MSLLQTPRTIDAAVRPGRRARDSSHAAVSAGVGRRRSGPGGLVYVFTPAGAVLETRAVPADLPLNCAFGDEDLTVLYASTCEGHLFRVRSAGRVERKSWPE